MIGAFFQGQVVRPVAAVGYNWGEAKYWFAGQDMLVNGTVTGTPPFSGSPTWVVQIIFY